MKEKTMHDGTMMLCKEIDEIVAKGKLTAGDLETLHKLSDTVKNFLKIEMLEGEGDDGEYSERRYSRDGGMYSERRDSRGRYSRDGGWEARGNYGGHSYDDGGSSYANRGKHYVRGHYSRAEGKESMLHELGMLMEDADEHERRALERAMQEIRNR